MITIIRANYQTANHRAAILALINDYAADRMGQGKALPDNVQCRLLDDLSNRPWVHVFLAYQNDAAVAIGVCIEGFSTFNSAPLLNIHDVYVRPEARRQGIAQALFAHIEAEARALGCCKLTLEVLEGNTPAQAAYRQLGFTPYTINDTAGIAMFWQKYLPADPV